MATATIRPAARALSLASAFCRSAARFRVVVEIGGATAGQHGLHIHEKGDRSDPAGVSGDHFKLAADTAAPTKPAHHAGDFAA